MKPFVETTNHGKITRVIPWKTFLYWLIVFFQEKSNETKNKNYRHCCINRRRHRKRYKLKEEIWENKTNFEAAMSARTCLRVYLLPFLLWPFFLVVGVALLPIALLVALLRGTEYLIYHNLYDAELLPPDDIVWTMGTRYVYFPEILYTLFYKALQMLKLL